MSGSGVGVITSYSLRLEIMGESALCLRKFSFDSADGKTAVSDSKKHSGLDLLRWQGVLPCAYPAHWLLQGLGFALFSFLRGPGYLGFLFPLLQYFPSDVALAFVGAVVAPSRKVATSD